MPKKKRGRKMPKWKKWAKAAVGVAGTVVGAGIALSPTYRGIEIAVTGRPAVGFNSVVFDMTGMDVAAGRFTPDIGRVVGVGITVAVGVGIMQVFKFFARRI